MEIYGKKVQKTNDLIYQGDLYKNINHEKSSYPEIVILEDNGRMVSLLLNENNDFISVEFQSNRVRDVFCLLMNRIK